MAIVRYNGEPSPEAMKRFMKQLIKMYNQSEQKKIDDNLKQIKDAEKIMDEIIDEDAEALKILKESEDQDKEETMRIMKQVVEENTGAFKELTKGEKFKGEIND